MITWSRDFIGEVLSEGDLAVDLTAGTGRDTLFLFQKVGYEGTVVAFDIQEEAIARTARLLSDAGARVFAEAPEGLSAGIEPGVHLIHDCHSNIDLYLDKAPKGVIANLGYLPGGDTQIITEVETTRSALEKGMEILAPGGRMVVVVYVGHPGGREEGQMLEDVLSELSSKQWHVLRLNVMNRRDSPYLLVAEKRRG